MNLIGRDAERTRLTEFVCELSAGRGGALIISGPVGSGKSALIDAVVPRSVDVELLGCAPTHTESQLPFAALHALLWPALGRVADLPEPQRDALSGALGLRDTTAEPFLVGAATLSLLSTIAEDRPLLVVIDDARWLDSASVECLAFVAHRLRRQPVGIVFIADGALPPSLGRFPIIGLGKLDPAAARDLLDARRADLPSAARRRLIELADGNPLALLELPVLDGPDAHTVAVGSPVREAFRARIAALGDDVRELLLVVAAHPGAGIGLLQDVAGLLGLPPAAWDAMAEAGMVDITDSGVGFLHRLVCLAVYDAAGPARQGRVHRAFAECLAADQDTAGRAWHLAAVASGPDEALAALLEVTAATVRVRDGAAAAARILQRAAALSPDPAGKAFRLVGAARAAWEAGDGARARTSLAAAEQIAGVDVVAVAGGGLAGTIEFYGGDLRLAYTLLLRDAMASCSANDHHRSEAMTVLAMWAASLAGELPTGISTDTGLPADLQRSAAATLRAWREGNPAAVTPVPDAWDPLVIPPATMVMAGGAEAQAYDAYLCALERARTQGNTPAAALTLVQMASVDLVAGRWAAAHRHAAEALAAAELGDMDNVAGASHAVLAHLAAVRGDATAACRSADHASTLASPRNARSVVAHARWALGVAALFTDSAEDAHATLRTLSDIHTDGYHPTFRLLAAFDAAEAALRVGSADEARRHVDAIDAWAEQTGSDWVRSSSLVLRALLTEGPRAEELFRDALHLTDSGPLFHRARVELLYGEWLRRTRRRDDARERITRATDAFRSLGATSLLRRGEMQLELATPSRRNPYDTADRLLTDQETRISRLAARGATNRAISSDLFISPRTVGHHLSAVYRKLGISSRTELAGMGIAGPARC